MMVRRFGRALARLAAWRALAGFAAAPSRKVRREVRCGLAGFLFVSVAACSSSPPTPPQETPAPGVARVTVEVGSLLLENPGVTEQLTAQALDADGNPVAATVLWESSEPGVVGVAADGTAEGVNVGSALVRARVGEVVSGPVLVSVGALAEDVVRIDSDKIVAEPVFPDGVSPFDVGSSYTVVLREVSPTVGRRWFSKTAAGFPVMGEITSFREVAEGTEVTLEIVPIGSIFRELKVDETLELASEELEVSEEVAANYHVERQGDGYAFTPKSAASVLPQAFDLGPFRCDGNAPPTTLSLGTPGFTLNTGNPTFRFVFDAPIPFVNPGRALFLFTASPRLSVTSGSHRINTNFNNLDVACKIRNGVRQPFSAFGFTFNAALTPGITVGGSYGAGSRTFSARLNATSNVRVGFDCRPPGGCSSLTRANAASAQGQVSLGGLGDLGTTIRDFRAGVFADVLLSVDIPFASLDLFGFRDGYEMTFDLASLQTQATTENPADYQIRKYARVDPFAAVESFVEFLLGEDAAESLGLEPIEFNQLAAQSPRILVASSAGSAPRRTVTVQLDPNRLNFFGTVGSFGLVYNVRGVELVEVRGFGRQTTVRTVGSVVARDGQTRFDFALPADIDTNDLYAAVVPQVMSELPMGTRRVQ